jgi:hypothetical protein
MDSQEAAMEDTKAQYEHQMNQATQLVNGLAQ